MLGPEGGLFAAQDADSEGVEGKYYVWTPDEIRAVLGADANWYLELYNPANKGLWEDNQWILLRDASFETFIRTHPELTVERMEAANDLLFSERKRRIPPATDTKCLTAWNAMTITGLVEAFRALEDSAYLSLALKVGKWLVNYQFREDGRLWHTRQNEKSFIEGMLDDYAFTSEAFLELYQATADPLWLEKAGALVETAMREFHDTRSGMFWFTPENHQLIARKMELHDNVIPSTNSVMAHVLLTLSLISESEKWEAIARQQMQNMLNGIENYGSGYSNWALLLLRFMQPRYVLHVHGETSLEQRQEVQSLVSPQLKVAYIPDEDEGYVLCGDGTCFPKAASPEEVRNQLNVGSGA
jgi:uncharacterized protein YyaL (SSP411 family)